MPLVEQGSARNDHERASPERRDDGSADDRLSEAGRSGEHSRLVRKQGFGRLLLVLAKRPLERHFDWRGISPLVLELDARPSCLAQLDEGILAPAGKADLGRGE